jgi:hypothetical protein
MYIFSTVLRFLNNEVKKKKEAVPIVPIVNQATQHQQKHHTLVKFPISNYYKPQIDKRT